MESETAVLDKMNYPLVSVIIPTHNRATLLPRAINSVLNQTYPTLEIVIVNDGSSDETDLLVNNYIENHPNIKYIKHYVARGGNAARNSGINAAKGEFVAGLDDDDEYLPNHIALLIGNYDERYSLIAARSLQVGKNYRNVSKYIGIVSIKTMLYFNAIGNQALIKRDRIVKCGCYDENLSRYQDYDMWLRLIDKYGAAKVINEVTQIVHYENSEINCNSTAIKNYRGAYGFYKKHKSKMNKTQKSLHIHRLLKFRGRNIRFEVIKDFIFKIIANLIVRI